MATWLRDLLCKTFRDPPSLWAMVAALATVVLLIVAWRQLRSLAKTSRSDFLYRLKSDFFVTEARQLSFLANEDLLKFHSEKDFPYFEILQRDETRVADRIRELGIEGDSVSIYLIDDVLLGPMEDIAVFEKSKVIDLDDVYEVFETYLTICVTSSGLKEYIAWSREGEGNEDVWENLLNLHKKLQKRIEREKR
jgi:hypothetical protein